MNIRVEFDIDSDYPHLLRIVRVPKIYQLVMVSDYYYYEISKQNRNNCLDLGNC